MCCLLAYDTALCSTSHHRQHVIHSPSRGICMTCNLTLAVNAHGHSLDFEMFPSHCSQRATYISKSNFACISKPGPAMSTMTKYGFWDMLHFVRDRLHPNYTHISKSKSIKLLQRHHTTDENKNGLQTSHILLTWIVDFDFTPKRISHISKWKISPHVGFWDMFLAQRANISQRPILTQFFAIFVLWSRDNDSQNHVPPCEWQLD